MVMFREFSRPRKSGDLLKRIISIETMQRDWNKKLDERCFAVWEKASDAEYELTLYRTPLETHVDSTSPEYHHLFVLQSENCALVLDGMEIVPQPGDVIVFDTSRPHSLEYFDGHDYENKEVRLVTFDYVASDYLTPFEFLYRVERGL